jgi:hypothetical protein
MSTLWAGGEIERVKGELVEMFQPVEHRGEGSEEASLPPADGSAAPSLPTRSDEQREVEAVEREGKRLRLVARERDFRGVVSWWQCHNPGIPPAADRDDND